MILRIKIAIAVFILYTTLGMVFIAYGGDRKNIKVYDSGEKTELGAILYKHYTLLDVGECDDTGCLIGEIPMAQWDGVEWIYQFIDTNDDGACDIIKIWKPLVDPTYGTYYSIHKTIPCKTLKDK